MKQSPDLRHGRMEMLERERERERERAKSSQGLFNRQS